MAGRALRLGKHAQRTQQHKLRHDCLLGLRCMQVPAHRTERQSWPSMGARTALSLSTSVFSVSEGKGTPRLGGALSRRDSTDGGTSSAKLRCGSTSWNLGG